MGLVSDPSQCPFRFVKHNVFGNFRVCANVCLNPCMRRVFVRPLSSPSPTATCFDIAPSSYKRPVSVHWASFNSHSTNSIQSTSAQCLYIGMVFGYFFKK